MKTISIELSSEQHAIYEKDPERFREKLLSVLAQPDAVTERLELVRTITRCKARVWNWEDLEREIFSGSV